MGHPDIQLSPLFWLHLYTDNSPHINIDLSVELMLPPLNTAVNCCNCLIVSLCLYAFSALLIMVVNLPKLPIAPLSINEVGLIQFPNVILI